MRIRLAGAAMIVLLGLFALEASAQGHGEHAHKDMAQKQEGVTIKGHVIDIVCFTRMDAVGPKHQKCAETCALQGSPMGIREDGTGEIFLVFPKGHGKPNEQVMAFLEKDVTVVGTVHRKGGIKGVTISRITERSAH